ncbi:MAG: site-specific DNA-methyltransferase [Patescibacteria group bacterium]|nr:site-specific DNA-methyltransferase [Patescibacteria group bacterium]
MILIGSALDRLRELPSDSVHCCVTSPPYFGLRSYGTPPQIWGGDPSCPHEWGEVGRSHHPGQVPDGKAVHHENAVGQTAGSGQFCLRCSAWRGDLGLEPSPGLYIEHLVAIFREVRRVLRPDGTLWLNIGDSYAGYWGEKYAHKPFGADRMPDESTPPHKASPDWKVWGVKPKDLIGVPWMLAFALRADGWWLRQDIIWSKAAPMPESVRDRCTRSHEYLFLLTKNARYFYDADAIAEPLDRPDEGQRATPAKFGGALKHVDGGKQSRLHSGNEYLGTTTGTRNKRSVWRIATEAFSESHFATFPTALVEPCIKASCPVGGTVLDPFFGAGTTGLVADRLGRKYIGIELNPTYAEMARKRIEADAGMFAASNDPASESAPEITPQMDLFTPGA